MSKKKLITGTVDIISYNKKSIITSFLTILVFLSVIIIYKIAIVIMTSTHIVYPFELLKIAVSMLGISYDNHEIHLFFIIFVCYMFLFNLNKGGINHIVKYSALVLFVLWLLFRSINLVVILYSNRNIEKDFITHMDKSLISIIADPKIILILILPFLFFIPLKYFSRKIDYRAFNLKERIVTVSAITVLLFIIFISIRTLAHSSAIIYYSFNYTNLCPVLGNAPEKAIYRSCKEDHSQKNISKNIDEKTVDKLNEFGLFLKPADNLPLYRNYVYLNPFPYSKTRNYTKYPNIIIFAFESFTTRVIGAYENKFAALTPYINNFSKVSLKVKNFYNSAAQTHNGLISLLSSYYPVFGPLGGQFFGCKESDLNMLSIMEVLKEKDYMSYNITPGTLQYGNHNLYFETNGTDKIYSYDDILQELNEPSKGKVFGCSDQQVIRFFIKWLKKRPDSRPFFVSLSTVDFHAPFLIPDDCIGEYNDNKIMRIIHNTDYAFGLFWSFFKKSKYFNNTIVIFTSDHAVYPGVEYWKLTGETTGYYDKIPFIIYDPTHNLPSELSIISGTVDVVPSLLHLLGINIPNPFEGLSIFDIQGRQMYPNLLGSHLYNFFFLKEGKPDLFELNDLNCDSDSSMITADNNKSYFSRCDFLNWWRYKRWLEITNRIWIKNFPVNDHIVLQSKH